MKLASSKKKQILVTRVRSVIRGSNSGNVCEGQDGASGPGEGLLCKME